MKPRVGREDFETYEKHLKNNMYKLWNWLSFGTYFPPPVLAVQIPKINGKMRTLGRLTIEDRVAQMTALIACVYE